MFKLRCPHCEKLLVLRRGRPGHKGPCPACGQSVRLLPIDDTDFKALHPFAKWCPGRFGRCSSRHEALARCGIAGSAYFQRNDPVLRPWWAARRKGLPACCCDLVPISKWTAQKLHLEAGWVQPPPFDPWGPGEECPLRPGPPRVSLTEE